MFKLLSAAGLTVFAIILIFIAVLAIGGLFWGWIIMLAWPLVSASTIAFAKAFWLGVIATVVLGALSN